MAEVILRLGPNNLESKEGFRISQRDKTNSMWWGEYEREVWGLLRDPYFFEIIFSQGEKYPQVNVLLLK